RGGRGAHLGHPCALERPRHAAGLSHRARRERGARDPARRPRRLHRGARRGSGAARARGVRTMKLLLVVLLAFAPVAAQAADKEPKAKKKQAVIAPNFAAYGIVTIGMAPVSSFDHDEANEREFRNAVETGFGTLPGYKLQQTSWFIDGVRKAGATGALAALEKSALNGAPSDTAAIAALQGKVQVDA